MAEIIEKHTADGALICDPFLGVGTTGKAAILLGRRFIGLDTDATALADTAERLPRGSLADVVQGTMALVDVTPGRWRTCAYCGADFPAQRGSADYCQPAHKQAAYRARLVTLAPRDSVTLRDIS